MNNKKLVFIPKNGCTINNNCIIFPNGTRVMGTEAYVFTSEEFKRFLEDYTNRIINEIGFVKTTSKELNSKDYQPFITDEDNIIWTINKKHITNKLTKFLKQLK